MGAVEGRLLAVEGEEEEEEEEVPDEVEEVFGGLLDVTGALKGKRKGDKIKTKEILFQD